MFAQESKFSCRSRSFSLVHFSLYDERVSTPKVPLCPLHTSYKYSYIVLSTSSASSLHHYDELQGARMNFTAFCSQELADEDDADDCHYRLPVCPLCKWRSFCCRSTSHRVSTIFALYMSFFHLTVLDILHRNRLAHTLEPMMYLVSKKKKCFAPRLLAEAKADVFLP